MTHPTTTIYRCGGAVDALGTDLRPASVAIRQGRILAIGPSLPKDLDGAGPVRTVDRPDLLLLPPMVNAHAHMDLTTLGPRPYRGSFVGWVRDLMKAAPSGEAATAAVLRGVEMSAAAGVGVVGDIARSLDSAKGLAAASHQLAGAVSYAECFGIGAGRSRGLTAMVGLAEQMILTAATANTAGQLRLYPGLEPHAPYSAAGELFNAANELGLRFRLRLATHLAETPEELEFVRDGSGPLAELLRDLDRWDDSIRPRGVHPVDLLAPALARGFWLAAHCNYVGDAQIATLARLGVSVAYCPVASEYFGHTGHRWCDMLDAGVNVSLGTDSILCQKPDEPQPLGILPQMRRLYVRDAALPEVLLAMATVNGARALKLSDHLASLLPGAPAPLGGVRFDPDDSTDALTQVLQNGYPFTPLDGSN